MESLTLRASPSTASPLLRLPGRRRAASVRVSASASSGAGEPDLSVTVNGLKMPNPFVIGSGPPGTNYTVMKRAFDEGWGGVIAKTVSLDAGKVINVTPRYARLRADPNGSTKSPIIGWQNIELISDRPLETMLNEFKQLKKEYPDRILIGSIMEEYNKAAWHELTPIHESPRPRPPIQIHPRPRAWRTRQRTAACAPPPRRAATTSTTAASSAPARSPGSATPRSSRAPSAPRPPRASSRPPPPRPLPRRPRRRRAPYPTSSSVGRGAACGTRSGRSSPPPAASFSCPRLQCPRAPWRPSSARSPPRRPSSSPPTDTSVDSSAGCVRGGAVGAGYCVQKTNCCAAQLLSKASLDLCRCFSFFLGTAAFLFRCRKCNLWG